MLGSFVWYELMTRDPAGAAVFYGELLGWVARDSGQPDLDYRLFSCQGVDVGGVMEIPPDAAAGGMPPRWFPYLSVPNVDQAVARYVAAGGSAHTAPFSVPGVGRIALVADPQGALLNLIAPVGTGPSLAFAPGKVGHAAWHELHAADADQALAFYSGQFGWTRFTTVERGEEGAYHVFGQAGGPPLGGIMTNRRLKRPGWRIVFTAPAVKATVERALANGGSVLAPPVQVPTGEWIAHLQDPQGAPFAIISRRA